MLKREERIQIVVIEQQVTNIHVKNIQQLLGMGNRRG
jgi:hypothetical protein